MIVDEQYFFLVDKQLVFADTIPTFSSLFTFWWKSKRGRNLRSYVYALLLADCWFVMLTFLCLLVAWLFIWSVWFLFRLLSYSLFKVLLIVHRFWLFDCFMIINIHIHVHSLKFMFIVAWLMFKYCFCCLIIMIQFFLKYWYDTTFNIHNYIFACIVIGYLLTCNCG